MGTTKPLTISQYIGGFPEDTQKVLQQVRLAIKKVVPDAEEAISYAIPAFKWNGKYLIYFAGYKNHISLYPAPRSSALFKNELSAYKGGKGTVQFPLDQPLPLNLITRIVQFRVEENSKKVEANESR